MTWQLYDMEPFRAKAQELSGTADEAEAEALYQWLLEEYSRLNTWDELAWIDFYSGPDPDGSLAEACRALDDAVVEAGDLLYTAAASALAGPAGDAFGSFVGEEAAETLADYEPMTDRETELLARETELELEYNQISSEEGLSPPSMNYRLGSVYLELVQVRTELAECCGYEDYASYAYEAVYGRDFTPADAAELCERIKPLARRYFENCYYNSALDSEPGRFSAGELLDLLEEYAPRISGRADEARAYLTDHHLYVMESAAVAADIGFTTTLSMYNAPFIFYGLTGRFNDLTGIFHEFGHYYDAYINPDPDPLGSAGSYDVFEIHSTGLEALMYGWYDEIFGDEAEAARIWCLSDLIESVISGCIYDEFQQYVFAHPDMSVEEINRAFSRIYADYGMPYMVGRYSYLWTEVSHNFESPFYYISYAVSSMAALQIWELAERDRPAALALYNEIVSRGAYDTSYCALLESVGLKSFDDDPESFLAEAFDMLEYMCLRYDGADAAA